jgi:hypothetical protein
VEVDGSMDLEYVSSPVSLILQFVKSKAPAVI